MIKKAEHEAEDVNTDFGAMLAETRKAKNFTVEQISQQLKIPLQAIVAIEANNVAALPPPTFTQGYIRTYAKFLELSEDKILHRYNLAVPHNHFSELKPRSKVSDEASSRTLLMRVVTICLIIFGLAVIIYGIYNYYQDKAEDMETELESKQRDFTGNSPGSLNTQNLTIRKETLPAVENVSNEDTKDVSENSLPVRETITNSIDEPAIAEIDNKNTLSQVDVLKIYAKKGSWMSVRDASNKRLLYNTVPVRGSMELSGVAPFRVSLGNARSTYLHINDLEIKMSEYIRENNTAKFTVSTNDTGVIFH
ncbi:MAG: helix-turn-helix domain-containing protein [Gammaproteobacteria bacterium]|nr:helix-turn-helix domain-containing protein [Gammaproteobacteria bacterium]